MVFILQRFSILQTLLTDTGMSKIVDIWQDHRKWSQLQLKGNALKFTTNTNQGLKQVLKRDS